ARGEIGQRITNWQNPVDDLLLGKRHASSARQLLLEVLTIHKVHDQVEALLPLKILSDLGDVVMVERLQPLGLLLKLATSGPRLGDQFFKRIGIVGRK